MFRTDSVLLDGVPMQDRSVPFVDFKAITGKCLRQLAHHPVASDLGDDRRRRDRSAAVITVDQRCLREPLKFGNPHVSVHDDVPFTHSKRRNRPSHREKARLQDIDLVNLNGRCNSNTEAVEADNAAIDEFSPGFGQDLRID